MTEDVFAVLSQVAQGDFTKCSIVYDSGAAAISFRTLGVPAVRVVDLKKLDFSADTPVKVLDMGADLSGNVTGSFVDYTRERNRQVIDACFAGTPFLRDMPPSLAQLIAAYPESTHADGPQ
jgi:hypothetical protein